MMFRFNLTFTTACAAGLLCASLVAGGFGLSLENPASSTDAKARNAVLIVRSAGCVNPATTKLTGTAEGVIAGQRKSITLDLVPLATAGTFAVMRQWPREGVWVLRLTAINGNRATSTLVPVNAAGFEREQAKYFGGEPPAEAINAMLGGD